MTGSSTALGAEFHYNPSYGNFLLDPAPHQLSPKSPETSIPAFFSCATLFPSTKNSNPQSLFLPLKPSLPRFSFLSLALSCSLGNSIANISSTFLSPRTFTHSTTFLSHKTKAIAIEAVFADFFCHTNKTSFKSKCSTNR